MLWNSFHLECNINVGQRWLLTTALGQGLQTMACGPNVPSVSVCTAPTRNGFMFSLALPRKRLLAQYYDHSFSENFISFLHSYHPYLGKQHSLYSLCCSRQLIQKYVFEQKRNFCLRCTFGILSVTINMFLPQCLEVISGGPSVS